MNEVIQAAAELQAVCELQGWRFCFIGGLALQRWGEPRETTDADLTLFAGFGEEEPIINVLLQHLKHEFPTLKVLPESAVCCYFAQRRASVWMWHSALYRLNSW